MRHARKREGRRTRGSRVALAIYVFLVLPIAAGLFWGARNVLRTYIDERRSAAESVLPARIGTTGQPQTGSNATIPMVLTGRAEICGGSIIKLDERTLRGLREQGLSYLEGAQDPRSADARGQRYNAWASTPVSISWQDEGFWPEIACMGLDDATAKALVRAATARGSFYTQMDDRKLLVSPSLGVVVATHQR